MATNTLSHNLDMTLEETQKLVDSYFTRYAQAGQFIKEAKEYAKEHGEVRTIFGDKLRCDKRRYATAGINYVLQNGASVAMQAGFFNMDYAIRQLGFEIYPKSVIHDSNQNMIKVEDLFYVARAYYHFFREYERDYIGVDFKYDLELMKNYRDHTIFSMDWSKGILTLDGPEDDIKYYEKYLYPKWDMKLVKEYEKKEEASEDLILDFSKDYNQRSHQYCMHPEIRRTCRMLYGRQYLVNHDWDNDPMFRKINELPLDMTSTPDRFIGNGFKV